ncbi:hypothetical protein PMKS-003469 [Pichia membranifaciens]|uniref:Uncharacterized protein n=1 Tax=Pichia membranifaciens TaxID=4926 RepID=A0A1Q2YKR1_9ASCO|nr:hypothetical protein PMKS-003469 [Pichia membranifaciens]
MTAVPHRHSISRRSSIQQLQQPQNGANSPRTGIRGRKVKATPNEVKTTMTRLEYLNNKFNVNPSFDVEISGDETDDSEPEGVKEQGEGEGEGIEGESASSKHRRADVQFDPKLLDIDILKKQQNVVEIESKDGVRDPEPLPSGTVRELLEHTAACAMARVPAGRGCFVQQHHPDLDIDVDHQDGGQQQKQYTCAAEDHPIVQHCPQQPRPACAELGLRAGDKRTIEQLYREVERHL